MTKFLTSVDPESGFAQLDTGERIKVTNMLDERGHDVADPAFCRRGVAGPCCEGKWYPFTCDGPDDLHD